MREVLKKKYEEIFESYGFIKPMEARSINTILRESLSEFLKDCKTPAIYCNGGHTKMLLADFVYELKEVKFIIDNYAEDCMDGGYSLIKDEELEYRGIDAVVISSFKFRKDIAKCMAEKHAGIRFLDIYEKFMDKGIELHSDYYYHNHPYHHYHTINTLQRKMKALVNQEELEKAYWELITQYLQIKDFKTAIVKAKEFGQNSNHEKVQNLIRNLEDLYETEQRAATEIAEDNVLMLCIDGLRKQDVSTEFMPMMAGELKKTLFSFENAYSYSTSTYESLIPVYSENQDLRTRYYNRILLEEDECRFICEAKAQHRPIFFYTDQIDFVESEKIHRSGAFQTASEKIWDFILDACELKNGLFYIHILYESHFTFSNPYTTEELISEGTAMLFDFLPQKGGRLRTDYEKQHIDALRYLDDTVTPLINKMKCRMVIYADHGNLILNKDSKLEEIPKLEYTCAEEWIRIPYMIQSPEQGSGTDSRIISLMSLNEIVISLMQNKAFQRRNTEYIKVARSELYNPNFRCLYKIVSREQDLLAFEAFIFQTGYKLIIYSNGMMELTLNESDERYRNKELVWSLFEIIKKDLTVCDIDKVKVD